MQIGNSGNGVHNVSDHRITTCMHDTKILPENQKGGTGGMAGQANPAAAPEAGKGFSLENLLQAFRSLGKQSFQIGHIWGRIWGDSGQTESKSDNGAKTDAGSLGMPASAESHAQYPVPVQNSSAAYFKPLTDDIQDKKEKRKPVNVLLKKFTFNKKNTGSEHPDKQQPKEEMTRRSHFRSDEMDMDCVITDSSFLLDSYDKKGNYTKIGK